MCCAWQLYVARVCMFVCMCVLHVFLQDPNLCRLKPTTPPPTAPPLTTSSPWAQAPWRMGRAVSSPLPCSCRLSQSSSTALPFVEEPQRQEEARDTTVLASNSYGNRFPLAGWVCLAQGWGGPGGPSQSGHLRSQAVCFSSL